MKPFHRLLVFLGVFIGTGIAMLMTLPHAPSFEYDIRPQRIADPIPEPVTMPPDPVSQERQKNKQLSRQRIQAEIGALPQVRTYVTRARQFSDQEIRCLALNVFHEARGEDITGQVGVAQVTLNRLDARYRGKKTLCSIVYDPKQFSWTLSSAKRKERPQGEPWRRVLAVTYKVAQGLRIQGLETTLHYHSDWIPPPEWSRKMAVAHVIGQHVYLGKAT